MFSASSGITWPPELYNLLRRCLTISPGKRITAKEALQHPALKQVERNGEGEQQQGKTEHKPETRLPIQ